MPVRYRFGVVLLIHRGEGKAMFEIDQGTGQPYGVPERRFAFFPRRLRNDPNEIRHDLQGADRRSGKDRRKPNGSDVPATARRNDGG
ncbi:MAG: hypothetical protein H7Y19_01850 [Luteimonas sp.]|nr:hypothetical protein [Luteimonas sp.]